MRKVTSKLMARRYLVVVSENPAKSKSVFGRNFLSKGDRLRVVWRNSKLGFVVSVLQKRILAGLERVKSAKAQAQTGQQLCPEE